MSRCSALKQQIPSQIDADEELLCNQVTGIRHNFDSADPLASQIEYQLPDETAVSHWNETVEAAAGLTVKLQFKTS